MPSAVVLLNPKTPFNVGNALRACSVFGVPEMYWTGSRVTDGREDRTRVLAGAPAVSKRQARLPREERMKEYQSVQWGVDEGALDRLVAAGLTPVCVEVDGAEELPDFEHPEDAVYVFGPEDSSVGKGVKAVCHRFVRIPGKTCVNLAAAVNIVLYDRAAKLGVPDRERDAVLVRRSW